MPEGILVFLAAYLAGDASTLLEVDFHGVETVGEFERDATTGPIKDNLIAALG